MILPWFIFLRTLVFAASVSRNIKAERDTTEIIVLEEADPWVQPFDYKSKRLDARRQRSEDMNRFRRFRDKEGAMPRQKPPEEQHKKRKEGVGVGKFRRLQNQAKEERQGQQVDDIVSDGPKKRKLRYELQFRHTNDASLFV